MALKVKVVIGLMLLAGTGSTWWVAGFPAHHWSRFVLYAAAVLLSSGMKVPMPKGEGTLSVNFPFILLGIALLPPPQAVLLTAISVFAQCRFKVVNGFTFVQIAFNVANGVVATAVACWLLQYSGRWLHELAPALCIAVTGYFLVNSVPVSFVIGWSSGQTPWGFWRKEFPWYLPFYLVGAVVAAAAALTSERYGLVTSLLVIPVIFVIYRAYRSQATMLTDRQQHLEATEALHLRTIEGLAMAIEAKDQNTHDHLLRVRVYVAEIGRLLQLDSLQLQALLTAAFLHDIGKLAVPEHIVNKPGKLTHEEFEKIKIHPGVGADILERMRFPYPVAPIVRSHHEAWDGTGYPDGLKGEDIPIGARILTVVDCFDAMSSDRPYRKAMPLDQAMAAMRANAGTKFDPRVIDVLEKHYVELEQRAHNKRGEIVPLDIVSPVERGLAPAAGFEEDGSEEVHEPAAPRGAVRDTPLDYPGRSRAMTLIAAASQEAQTLFEMGQMLGSSLSPNETISVMSRRLKQLIPFACLAIYLRHDDLLITQYVDEGSAHLFNKTPIHLGDGVSGWVAKSGKPILNGSATAELNMERNTERNTERKAERSIEHPDERKIDGDRRKSFNMKSALSLPLFDLNGDVFGVLTVYSAGEDPFSRDHLRILQAVEGKFSLSLQNALRFRSAEKEASIDYVTQLPNVRQFFLAMEGQLEHARHSGVGLSLIVCDLNSFKAVNDRHGHLSGNLLLRRIADGFRNVCGRDELVARMGGDEFVFLLPGRDPARCARCLAEIDAVVLAACTEQELSVNVSTSVGLAHFPADGVTAEELLGVADRRMYRHKRTHYEEAARAQNPPQTEPEPQPAAQPAPEPQPVPALA